LDKSADMGKELRLLSYNDINTRKSTTGTVFYLRSSPAT
jgi:hypothetical protein